MAIKRKMKNGFGRIGILMGGPSSEREISLKSGRAVFESLKNLHPDVVAIDIKTDDFTENIRFIQTQKIDCAFLALHGRFGEDGSIQEILDTLKLPYTGSGKLASKLAMDKIASRNILEVHGLNVPPYRVIEKVSYHPNLLAVEKFVFPLVVKPAAHGSSIGLSMVERKEDLPAAVELALQFDQRILAEEYIPGREMTVGVLDRRALPVIEIVPKKRFFDYEAKYSPGLTDYIIPARLEKKITRQLQSTGLLVHQLLGCDGFCRVDMILNPQNRPFVLEVNTIPGFTQTSLFPKAAKSGGMEFGQLCLELIRLAYEKA